MIISTLRKLKHKYRIRFLNGTYVHKGSDVSGSRIGSFVLVGNLANIKKSKIGNYSSVGRYANIINAEVGKYCSISWNVTIGATSHPVDHLSTHAFSYISFFNFAEKNTTIDINTSVGNDVWFGANSIVLPGVKIGNGAVIGAGAVVTKDVPPFAIVVGSPAKIIKYRFSDDVINELQAIRWWDLSHQEIKENLSLWKETLSPDILKKLKKISNKK